MLENCSLRLPQRASRGSTALQGLVPKTLIWSSLKNKSSTRAVLSAQQARNFGIIQEYNERKNKKLINNVLCTEEPKFWVTSSRPANFGDPIDTKTKVDNWFDENRLWNEESKDYEIKRAQIYMV